MSAEEPRGREQAPQRDRAAIAERWFADRLLERIRLWKLAGKPVLR